jgi:diaminopimelate epimerase
MAGISFCKMSGSGNDFIIIDNRRGVVPAGEGPALARRLCRRRFSIGADGLILINRSGRADFSWGFFNADGSEAAMCGNGGRCAARFANLKGLAGEKMSFETGAGLIRAEIRGERVKLQLPDPYGFRPGISLKSGGKILEVSFLVVGVPHAVVHVEDLGGAAVAKLGRAIRGHGEFAPDGANVNFYTVEGSRRLSVRTYVRGVEGETMACGTGWVAAALSAAVAGRVKGPVRVLTRGGEELTVYSRRRKDVFREVYLEGAADVVYEGKTWANPAS